MAEDGITNDGVAISRSTREDGGEKRSTRMHTRQHVNGRPLVYSAERYLHPVLMDPAHFDWMPVAGQPGVSWKLLGEFSERRTRIAFGSGLLPLALLNPKISPPQNTLDDYIVKDTNHA